MFKGDGDAHGGNTHLPQRIGRLRELGNNLWWSWHPEARELFRTLDYPLWSSSGHNPIRQLNQIALERLEAAAGDQNFTGKYDAVMAAFDAEMTSQTGWLARGGEENPPGGVAFFSMEFAVHYSLPMYAGGLGVLAGDICKEASDLGVPLVGVGFMYPQGYFYQRVSADGWQEEIYRLLDFSAAPISGCPEECAPVVTMDLGQRKLHLRTWLVRVGRVNLYLLDTNLEENAPTDRLLSARLYTADREQRLQQEVVLGVGGVHVLEKMGLSPSVWHANEGHTSFMMMERLRREIEKGASFQEGVDRIRAATLFTTHTPVAAGHDVFSVSMLDRYLGRFWGSNRTRREEFLSLGKSPGLRDGEFNMTVLGLRLSCARNAVSEIHTRTSRRMWQNLWPGVSEDDVPIVQVTNGVHLPTWIAPEMRRLYEKYLGADWLERQDDGALWEGIMAVPDDAIWSVRQALKHRLIEAMLTRNRECGATRKCSAEQVVAMGAMFDAETLTIGFARRFAEYKRPTLVLSDVGLLRRILTDVRRPVQLVFAGKSHPADVASKSLLNQVYGAALNRDFEGRIAFVEDYDIHVAHDLVAGVDVWLNTPRRLEEACGTSGMKAALNGVLHFSVPDGWWYEAYDGSNGWVIGENEAPSEPWQENTVDGRSLYDTLQDEIIPLYYDKDRAGVPHGWVRCIKAAIRSIVPQTCARRMMKGYSELYMSLSHQKVGS